MRSPGQFDRFTRGTRRSAGKVYSIIFGWKGNKSQEQAYRYKKDTWTAAQARKHCRDHNGSFEAARESNMERITANIDGQVRTQVFDGRAHLVMPVVLLVEGVHTGASGIPTYYSPEEMMASAHLWNGIPVPVSHPENSANQPDVIEECVVGRLFNVHFDENGNKLRGEIYLDPEKTRRISAELLDAIRGNENIEVSTGLYFDAFRESGDWNGEHYEIQATNFHPDHLALLPGQVGACSWDDGCGVRANQNKKGDMRVSGNTQRDSGTFEKLRVIAKQFVALFGSKPECAFNLTTHEASHEDIRGQLQAQLDAMDNVGWVHFVRDIYDDHFIYEARYRGDNPSDEVVAGAQKFYQRGYDIGEDEQVTMKDSPAEVREERKWVALSAQTDNKADDNKQSTHEEESNMDKKKVIDGLIANEKNEFCEKDREWLDSLEEERLAKIAPCANKEDEPPGQDDPATPPVKPPESKPTDPPEPTPPEPKPEDNKQPATVDEYVAKAPPEVASVLKRAVTAENAKKDEIVKELVANKRCKFTEEQLKAKDVTELEQLAELANVEVDFTGRVGAPANAEPEGMPMPPVFEKIK